jgi:type IV pilus assembly protein PilM
MKRFRKKGKRMSNAFIGMDIGNVNCKIAVRDGDRVKILELKLPENIARDGDICAPESMVDFLRRVRRTHHIHVRNVALALPESKAYFRHVTLPKMTVSELKLNLPYEFKDYIDGAPEDYYYDYLIDESPVPAEEQDPDKELRLYAAAIKRKEILSAEDLFRKAGFRLKVAIPEPIAYMRLLREEIHRNAEIKTCETVFADIGYHEMVMMLFKGSEFSASKTVQIGTQDFDVSIAEQKNIDQFTAASYKYNNFEGIMDSNECQRIYDRFALEISKVVNFYNFNNPNGNVDRLFYLGGGAQIPQLTAAIRDSVDIPCDGIRALLPEGANSDKESMVCALSVAALLEGEATRHGN